MYQKPKCKTLSYHARMKRLENRKLKILFVEKEIINNYKMNKYKLHLSILSPVNDYDIYDEVA